MPANAKRIAKRTRAKLLAHEWAIREHTLKAMIAAVERRGPELAEFQSIAKERGHLQEETNGVIVRDAVAYISVTGVLSRYMGFFEAMCGGVSYEHLATDLGAVLDDKAIRAIVWDIDSPGGEVNGCSELARLIFDSRGAKEQVAFISGDGCSAAYWLASAASRIYAGDTSVIGCLGCQAAFLDDRKYLEREGLEEIVIISSQTPNKNRDVATDEGRAQVQRVVDALADRFLDSVAQYRGLSRDVVQRDFGAGDVFIGEEARRRKMIDGVMTLEQLHAQLTAAPAASTPARSLTSRALAASSPESAMQNGTAAARVTAIAQGDECRALVARNVAIAEGDVGKVAEVREGATVIGFEGPSGTYQWLLAEEVESTSAADTPAAEPGEQPTDAAPAGDPEYARLQSNLAALRASITSIDALTLAFPQLVAAIRAEERTRVLGILDLTPTGQERLARTCIENGASVDAAGRQFLEASRGSDRARLSSFVNADTEVFTPPAVEAPAADPGSAEAVVARIRAAGRAARGENN